MDAVRLAFGLLPFERSPNLSFTSSVPRRWVAGFGRELLWDFGAALLPPAAVELESRIELEAAGLVVTSTAKQQTASGEPLLRASARFGFHFRASQLTAAQVGNGPSVIEVTTMIGAPRTIRAELVMEVEEPRGVVAQDARHAPPGFALGLGDWS